MTISDTDRARIVEAMLEHFVVSIPLSGLFGQQAHAAEITSMMGRCLDAALSAGLTDALRPREVECYAERLAVSLWEKHYQTDAPQWKPLTGDLIGLLTQIDNMTSGLVRADAYQSRGIR